MITLLLANKLERKIEPDYIWYLAGIEILVEAFLLNAFAVLLRWMNR